MDDDRLHELFASIGPIRIKRMFGGKGIYVDGMIVAVVADELMMRADAECAGTFEAAGSRQWTYARNGRKPVRMPYWTLPDDAHDDPAIMERFAAASFGAARRAQDKTSPSAKPKRPGRAKPSRPS